MRTQLLFSVLVGIAVTGCGNSEQAHVPRNTADTESPDEFIPEDVPYHLIETAEDGSQVIQYCVEVFRPETRTRTNNNGREEIYTVMLPSIEERMATFPPGEDISAFLRLHSGGRIFRPESYRDFDENVEPAPPAPAPAPAAPAES